MTDPVEDMLLYLSQFAPNNAGVLLDQYRSQREAHAKEVADLRRDNEGLRKMLDNLRSHIVELDNDMDLRDFWIVPWKNAEIKEEK